MPRKCALLVTVTAALFGISCGSSGGKAATSQDASACVGSSCNADAAACTGAGCKPDGSSGDRSSQSDRSVVAGCTITQLDAGQTGPHGLIELYRDRTFGVFLAGIEIDGGYLYFKDEGLLRRVPITGGPPEDVMSWNVQSWTFVIRNSSVIWVESAFGGKTQLLQASIGSADAGAPTVLVDNIDPPDTILSDGQALYWDVLNSANGGIHKLTLANSKLETLVPDAGPTGMVLQGTYLYWNDSSTEEMKRIPVAGGTAESVAQIFWGGPMAADDLNIYWADGSDGVVMKWPLAGGTQNPTTLWQSTEMFEWPDSIAVAAGWVYFHSGDECNSIVRINRDGTGQAIWASIGASPNGFALDDKYGYVVTDTSVFRFDL